MEKIAEKISENRKRIEERISGCDDILLRPMMLGKERETECFLIYIETAVSNLMLEDSVIGRFLNELRELGLRLEEGFYMGVFRADYRKDGSVNWYSAVITDDETADFHKPDMLFKAILKK